MEKAETFRCLVLVPRSLGNKANKHFSERARSSHSQKALLDYAKLTGVYIFENGRILFDR